jgi:hypothetical protein
MEDVPMGIMSTVFLVFSLLECVDESARRSA